MIRKILLPIFLLVIALIACGWLPQSLSDIKLSGTVTHTAPTPVDKVDAKQAIQTYAQDVLGIQVPKLIAGGGSGEISLPVNLMEEIDIAVDLAGRTYFGVWSGGIASLSYGDSDLVGDFSADMCDGALGVFTLNVKSETPEGAADALNLLLETYPGLIGYQWVETPTETGYAFTTGELDHVSVESWSLVLSGTTINAGVVPGVLDNQSFVWVVVASGLLAAPFQQ